MNTSPNSNKKKENKFDNFVKQGGVVGFLGRKIFDKKEKKIDFNALKGMIGIGMMVVGGISIYRESVSTPSPSLKNLKIETYRHKMPDLDHGPHVLLEAERGFLRREGFSNYEIDKWFEFRNPGPWRFKNY